MKKILIITLGLGSLLQTQAQDVKTATPNSTGGKAVIATNTYEWSVGQVAINTGITASNVITAGVLQPFYVPEAISSLGTISNNFSVLPNISFDKFVFTANEFLNQDINLEVFDALGKVIIKENIKSNSANFKHSIDLTAQPSATYYVLAYTNKNNKIFYNHFKLIKK